MMNDNEINRILEKTKEKIAISQFKEERIEEENMKNVKNNKLLLLKRTIVVTAAGMLLTVGSVGAYVGITGNYEILRKIGINIGERYENEKQEVKGNVDQNEFKINLVSAACDSSCIILEMDVKLDGKKYEDIDFKIDNFSLEGKRLNERTKEYENFSDSTKKNLKISESTVSNVLEDGTIKLFKYISVKDPNLAGDGFIDELFRDSNKAVCKIEFSRIYDVKTSKVILEGNWNLDFNLTGKESTEFTIVNKDVKVEDVDINIYSIAKSPLGNYITIYAEQDNFNYNTENNIQKLDFIIKNKAGEKVNIVSKTCNITGERNYLSYEVTLKLDDISNDLNYNIDFIIGEKCNISMEEIKEVVNIIEQEKIETENNTIDDNNNLNEEIIFDVGKNDRDLETFIVRNPLNSDLIITKEFDIADEEHNGIDLMTDDGESIYAVNDGEVFDVGFSEEDGKYIIIKHTNGFNTVYAACSEILKEKGDKVKAGDEIAKAGSTGMSTGPHLHFEIWDYNISKNPKNYLK